MSGLGVDSFTAFVSGIGNLLNMNFGTIYPIVNGIIIVIVLFINRSLIGITTVLNMGLIGFSADLFRQFLLTTFPNANLTLKFVIFILSLILMGLGISFYLNSDLGGGAYDAIQLIMTDKIKSLQYKYSRIICDVISVIIGYIGRAVLGVGTVINAFLMGPIVSVFDKHLLLNFMIEIMANKKSCYFFYNSFLFLSK
ncbi:YitT family protein [uncultured Anaerococcus sp.]|uniref:YczE/YyaS/YitT family protein n=1 Tax=uncultured Anaerococcus sp. TaxID=293428 RepID=UPI0025F0FDD3|nr:hypothetical protein [uncultured Anaerococcus sp.]